MQGDDDLKPRNSSIRLLRYSILTACVGTFVFVVAILSEPDKPHRDGMLWLTYLTLLSALIGAFRAWWNERKDKIQ